MKIIFLLLLIPNCGLAQQRFIQKDTSFTVFSAFAKEVKSRPFIKIAEAEMPEGILSKYNKKYASIGNRKLYADVFYPETKSKKKFPCIVMIFGGGWRSGNRSQNIPLAQQLAAKGYVAITIDYRLSTEAKYPAAVYDIKAAIRWIRAYAKQFNLDKNKIAALGMSAGGQLAALAGTTNGNKKLEGNEGNSRQSSAVQAIVDIDGILAFHHPESKEGTVASEWLGGTYEQIPGVWEEASPLHHVGKNTPPILFINSSLPRFYAGRDDVISVLNNYGIYSEVHTLPDTPHPFWLFHPWFKSVVEYTVNFLDKVFTKEK